VNSVSSRSDALAAEWSGTAVHTGEFEGRAPTGERVSIHGKYEGTLVDGKLAGGRNEWNYADLLRQIDS
jgi:hypothetical protein